MADQPAAKKADTGASGGEEPAKKGGKKTIIIIAVILVVEAVAIVGAMMMLGGPKHVEAATLEHGEEGASTEGAMIVEVPVLDAKMPNNKSGVTYIYATEVFAQVKQKDAERVTAEVEQFKNEIKAEMTAIWRTAEPHHFQEPKLENLTRRVHALLNERFGKDDQDQPIVQKVVIVMSTGFRIDS